MEIDLSTITAAFPAGEWATALGGVIRRAEAERVRAGRIMHDEVGQLLTAAGMQMGLISIEGLRQETAASITTLQALLEETLEHVREVTRLLSSSISARAGLRFALEQAVQDKVASFSGHIHLEYPENLRVPTEPARCIGAFVGNALDFAIISGAKFITVIIRQERIQFIIEILYDVMSPTEAAHLAAGERLNLLSIHYDALRTGLRVCFEQTPNGRTILRAVHTSDPD